MKKATALILAALILSMSVVSCSESEVNNESENKLSETPSGESGSERDVEETSKYLDDLPKDLKFDGDSVRFIIEDSAGGLAELSILAEEDTGDVVDSAVIQRNNSVKERLNVDIGITEVFQGGGGIAPRLQQSATAGTCDFEVMSVYQYYGIGLASSGNVYNLAKMPYVDFSREYWGTNYINDMSYKNATYWATGDLALKYVGGMYVTFVNDVIWNDHYSDINVYDLVNEGSWTLDKFTELAEGVYTDADGDGKHNDADIYGFSICYEDPIDGLVAGSDIHFSEKDETGTPVFTLNNEHTIDFYNKLYKLICENPNTYIAATDDNTSLMNFFAASKSMLLVNKLYQSGVYLRDMEEAYKIVPVPKFDENQQYYITRLHDSVSCYGLPISNKKYELTGAVLEAMASDSFKYVTPAYYEKALKYKYARDSESGQMIELIRQHATSDFASLYSNSIADIVHFFRQEISAKSTSISSSLQKREKIWNKSLKRLLEGMEKNADK